jgi:Carboxypeptidase regulatory-like domain
MRKTILVVAFMMMLVGGAMAGTITGLVVDSENEPVAEAYVSIAICDSTGNGGWNGGGNGNGGGCGGNDDPTRFTVLTDADGNFQIDDVPAGNHNIRAMKRGYGGVREEIEVPETGIIDVELQLAGNDNGGRRRQRLSCDR